MELGQSLSVPEVEGLQVEVFKDIGISGKDATGHPDYLRLLDRLTRGDVHYVVAYDQSRITRNVADLQHFRDTLARVGALFIESSMRRVTDPNDEDQELGSNILGSVDQHYRKKVHRVSATLSERSWSAARWSDASPPVTCGAAPWPTRAKSA